MHILKRRTSYYSVKGLKIVKFKGKMQISYADVEKCLTDDGCVIIIGSFAEGNKPWQRIRRKLV